MAIVIKQEDSHFRDFRRSDGLVFDVNWSGKWEIQDSDDAVVANGVASISSDTFKLEYRVKKADTATLSGTYTLIFEITNVATGFQKEVIETLHVTAQKLT